TGVSSGPLSPSRVRAIDSIVASGIGLLQAATPAAPATCRSHTKGALTSSRIRSVASVMSGPIPSPGISVQGIDMTREILTSDEEIRHVRGERCHHRWCEGGRRIAGDVTGPLQSRTANVQHGHVHYD